MRSALIDLDAADAAFLAAFEAGEVAPANFHHADHVRLTWACVRLEGADKGGDRVAAAIRGFASVHAPGKYHETITRAWVRLVAAAVRDEAGDGSFEEFLERHPDLLDTGRLRPFYSGKLLSSEAARREWREPDLLPLP